MAEALTAAWYTAVFCVVVVTVVLLLKLKGTSASRRDDSGLRKKNLPPGPWTLPVIGSMYCLLGALPHHALHRLARRYGPVMLRRLGHVSTLVVSSPEAAKEVMKTQDAALVNRPVNVTMNILTYGGQNIALSPYTSKHWKELRRLCATELLSPRRVLAFRPIREEEAASLDAAIISSSSSPTAAPVNVSEKVRLMMNDIIMRAILGNRSPQREAYVHEMGSALKLLAGFNLIDLFPALRPAKVIGGRSLREARQVHARKAVGSRPRLPQMSSAQPCLNFSLRHQRPP
ncbi:hypothetical protein QOZ80_6AG0516330 [Eleusine coracana subsp. coracana]|nr:hypothetical protein QOZ80_6AG0516330 [Eleusine coracana subsp. coracana]